MTKLRYFATNINGSKSMNGLQMQKLALYKV